MNQIKKHKLLATKALQFNRRSCIKLDNFQQILYQTFNLTQDCHINLDILNKIIFKPTTTQILFSHEEFKSTINKYITLSTSVPDCILWKYLKLTVKNKKCLNNFVNIANVYIEFGHWLAHFKKSFSIIIPKPNKVSYNNSPKYFRKTYQKSYQQTYSIPCNLQQFHSP